MPSLDVIADLPLGTRWPQLDRLAEVAELAAIEYEQKKVMEHRRRLVVRFGSGGNKNDHEMRKGIKAVNLPMKEINSTGQGFMMKKMKNLESGLFDFVPKRRRSFVVIKKIEQDVSATLETPIKRPLESVSTNHEEKIKPKKRKKMDNLDLSGKNTFNNDENPKRKTKKTKKKKEDLSCIPFPTELPMELQNLVDEMKGSDLMVVLRKALTKTDISKNHGRLSIPQNKVERVFLTPSEKKMVDDYNSSNISKKEKTDVTVFLIDSLLRKWNVKLKRWDMENSYIYALLSGWSKFVKANGLQEKDVIQLWSFRSQGRLCFIPLVVRSEHTVEKVQTAE